MKLSPTYTYARIYEQGDKLMPHTDRPACEISATAPIYSHDGAPSTMYISNYKINPKLDKPRTYTLEQVESIGDYTEVNLYPGDVLFYRGCEKYHWRKPLKNKYLMQFFMHYVETDGEHSEWYFDKRPYSGFNSIHKDKASDIAKLPIII
jgi:alkylated DNA repair dioxygenase AlkB